MTKTSLRRTCRYVCSVPQCKTNDYKNSDLTFHCFPKKGNSFVSVKNAFGNLEQVEKQKAWTIASRMNQPVRNSSRICSLHFKPDDYHEIWFPTAFPKLKPSAVPSCRLPESSIPKRKINEAEDNQRYLRRNKRASLEIVDLDMGNVRSVQACESESTFTCSLDTDMVIQPLTLVASEEIAGDLLKLASNTVVDVQGNPLVDVMTVLSTCQSQGSYVTNTSNGENHSVVEQDDAFISPNQNCSTGTQTSLATSDKATQVSCIPFIDAIRTDKHLSTATGIESFKILDLIVNFTRRVAKNDHQSSKLTLRDKILMTYVKLKQNCSYAFLSLIFNHVFTPVHCKTIFFDTIHLLSAVLKVAISWPDKDNISRNLPKCFTGFEDVAVVLDCTEIFIQNPSSLKNQVITYSTYKGHATWKIMTGVSPAGDITYLSPVYGGRVSDKAIFEQCDIGQFLNPGDAIMVDKGFLIDTVCDLNRWKLIRPPFLRDKAQLSKTEANVTSRIAAARVHIERSNQRIKVFKIVGDKMSSCLLPVVEDIFTVICATVNLGAPILKDDKFFGGEL